MKRHLPQPQLQPQLRPQLQPQLQLQTHQQRPQITQQQWFWIIPNPHHQPHKTKTPENSSNNVQDDDIDENELVSADEGDSGEDDASAMEIVQGVGATGKFHYRNMSDQILRIFPGS